MSKEQKYLFKSFKVGRKALKKRIKEIKFLVKTGTTIDAKVGHLISDLTILTHTLNLIKEADYNNL